MANILVIDDSGFSRRRVVSAIAGAGHAVTEACDGQQGLDLIQNGTFDCVCTDNLMPVMEGLEMLRLLRDAGDKTPVIMCSADIQSSTRAACEELGIVSFIGKPFKADELVAMVSQACGVGTECVS